MKTAIEKRALIDKNNASLSLNRQCEILGICRSSLYYNKVGQESKLNLELMRLMDEKYIEHPEFGAERMHNWLTCDRGFKINKKRVERLYYYVMGLKAVMPGPHTSTSKKEHKKYPYLLKKLIINKVNQVWMTDITYLPMEKGFMYMVAFIDVYSRKLLHWSISNTMDSLWCCAVLEECIEMYGLPQIINTDQGSQFTSDDFVYRVTNNGIKLSMDGKGRALDNIYIERFWRTLKYEHVYIRPASTANNLWAGIKWFVEWYNEERRHSKLDKKTPNQIYQTAKRFYYEAA